MPDPSWNSSGAVYIILCAVISKRLCKLTTRLQVLFINDENDEGGLGIPEGRVEEIRGPRVHINMTFFRLSPS